MNCKPGQRAVIIKAKSPSNLGRVVLVIEPFQGGRHNGVLFQHPKPGDGPAWLIESLGSPLAYMGDQGARKLLQSGPMPDAWLKPLADPDGLNQEITERTPEEATA